MATRGKEKEFKLGKNLFQSKLTEILFVNFLLILMMVPSLQAAIAVLNGLTHEFKVMPGQSYEGVIVLKNMEQTPAKARLYQADYLFNASGQKFFPPPGTNLRSNSSWVSFYPSSIDLPPQGSLEVKFRIIVPNDPSLKGTYWSLIMVEQTPVLTQSSFHRSGREPSLSLNQIVRYGVQIVTHIGETGERKLRISRSCLINQQGKYKLQLVVENVGERCLVPDLSVQLFNESGEQVGQFTGQSWRLYPLTSALYQVDLGSLEENKYKALILLDSHDDHVFAAKINLNLNSADLAKPLANKNEEQKTEKIIKKEN